MYVSVCVCVCVSNWWALLRSTATVCPGRAFPHAGPTEQRLSGGGAKGRLRRLSGAEKA